MKKINLCLFFVAFIFTLYAQNATLVVDKMLSAIQAGKTYEYTLNSIERIKGKNYSNQFYSKVQLTPHKIYMKSLDGESKGLEILYEAGTRSNKVLINKLTGIKLSPFSNLVRKHNHHTIFESGFALLAKSVSKIKTETLKNNRFNEVFQLEGAVTFDGVPCYKLVIRDPDFTYENYTIRDGESLYDISMDKIVSEQLIVEKNGFNNFNGGQSGQIIKIPTSYAKKTILYINKRTFFPVYQEMHDEKGLFEKYEFINLKINPSFSDLDFSADNPNYSF